MRLIARFAAEPANHPDHYWLITQYDEHRTVDMVEKENPVADSLVDMHPAANWFERKIHEDFGIAFTGNPDQRPLQLHETFAQNIHPLQKTFNTDVPQPHCEPHPYAYEVIDGDQVFQVSVGPIHAGIIEPGHFHFSQAGEDMLHLEVRHFYKYRGIEKQLEGLTLWETKPIIERISGTESISYQIAWRDIVAQAAYDALPLNTQYQHAILLELERLAHHFNDLGMIPNDAGFAPALAWGSQLSEQVRRQLKQQCGHRFGFGAIQWDHCGLSLEEIKRNVDAWRQELNQFKNWVIGIPSLWDRLDNTGKFSQSDARRWDTVGVMARASGIEIDARHNQRLYQSIPFAPICNSDKRIKGDVAARYRQRLNECTQSLDLIDALIQAIEAYENTEQSPIKPPAKLHDGLYNTFVETPIGELFMEVHLKEEKIERFYVRDPSFINWQALPALMPGNIIADFPLINKSCDLSYAGNDL